MPSIHLVIIGDEILSGRRADKHFEFARDLLAERNLSLAGVRYVGDDTTELVQTLKESFARTHAITFVFGGIGATPDDKTRQAAAVALGFLWYDIPKVSLKLRLSLVPMLIPFACAWPIFLKGRV